MEQAEQVAEIKARCKRVVNTVTEQLPSGFIVTATINYQNPDTGGFEMNVNLRDMANTPQQAATMVMNALTYGEFTPPAAPVNFGDAAAQPVV